MPKKKSPGDGNGDYEIGKGKPPRASRWGPGQCGNPRGRPKKAKGTVTMAREELARLLPVIVNGRKRQMSVRALAYRKLGDKTATGDQKAFAFLLMLAKEFPPPESQSSEANVSAENDAEIIKEFLKRMQRRAEDKA